MKRTWKEFVDFISEIYETTTDEYGACICPECNEIIYEEDYLFVDYKDELPICPFCESAID